MKREVPEKVRESFEKLKKTYEAHIELRHLNNRFCVFEATSKWDSSIGRSRKITRYIGWITDEGFVVPARKRIKSESRSALELRYLEKLNELEDREKEANESAAMPVAAQDIKEGDITLLRALSMNSRLTYSRISAISKIRSPRRRIRKLESEFGIKYTEELDLSKLGFSDYFILARFIGNKPDFEELKGTLEKEPRIQLAMLTKGYYDIVIFCTVENNVVLTKVLDAVRRSDAVKGIRSKWFITPASTDYGFIPLREKFFELLKERVWRRKRKGEKPSRSDLMVRDYALLKEFNSDSTTSFAKIDEKYKLPMFSARNAYERLREEETGVLKRPTITMQGLNYKYNAIIIAEVLDYEGFMNTRDDHRRYIINEPENNTMSRFSYVCDIETPDGIMYIFPVFKEGDVERIQGELSHEINGVKFRSLIVERVIIGSLAYRKFDNFYSVQYLSLVRRKAMVAKERVDYN